MPLARRRAVRAAFALVAVTAVAVVGLSVLSRLGDGSPRGHGRRTPGPAVPGGGPAGTARVGHRMVYDPLNKRLVVHGGWARRLDGCAQAEWDDVLAFDPATRTWTVLLEPSEPYDGGAAGRLTSSAIP